MHQSLRGAALGLALAAGFASPLAAKTLVYCSEGSPEGFNPSLYTAGTTFDASSRQVFDKLVQFERGTTKIVPGLAESWTVSEDGRRYTFKLREGVRYAGPTEREITAGDFVYAIKRFYDPRWNSSDLYLFESLALPGLSELEVVLILEL